MPTGSEPLKSSAAACAPGRPSGRQRSCESLVQAGGRMARVCAEHGSHHVEWHADAGPSERWRRARRPAAASAIPASVGRRSHRAYGHDCASAPFPTWLLARLVLVPRRAGFFAPRSVRASAVVLCRTNRWKKLSHIASTVLCDRAPYALQGLPSKGSSGERPWSSLTSKRVTLWASARSRAIATRAAAAASAQMTFFCLK